MYDSIARYLERFLNFCSLFSMLTRYHAPCVESNQSRKNTPEVLKTGLTQNENDPNRDLPRPDLFLVEKKPRGCCDVISKAIDVHRRNLVE